MKDNDTRWFVSGQHYLSGRPVLEKLLMREAIAGYMHCIIYEKDLPRILTELDKTQKALLLEKPNLKEIGNLSVLCHTPHDDVAWLTIGESHLTLQKVKNTIEY